MKKIIGWFEGSWGSEEELLRPLINQGVNRGNGIFETILILNGQPKLLNEHIKRWHKSSLLLKMKKPPSEELIHRLIQDAVSRIGLEKQDGFVRLNWCNNNIELQGYINQAEKISGNKDHDFWLEISFQKPYFKPISTLISRNERRNPHSLLSQCKSFNYLQSIQAKKEALLAGCDDALLLNTNGQLCCGTTSNILVRRRGEWLTPNLNTGCLAGIMRQQGLESGLIREAKVEIKPEVGDEWLLINSLSCRPIISVNNYKLKEYKKAKELWISLLKAQKKQV
tara:strand:+ start:172 stop:1017 length:846 start_codon:yes stop_codon:yes gene_type:complete